MAVHIGLRIPSELEQYPVVKLYCACEGVVSARFTLPTGTKVKDQLNSSPSYSISTIDIKGLLPT